MFQAVWKFAWVTNESSLFLGLSHLCSLFVININKGAIVKAGNVRPAVKFRRNECVAFSKPNFRTMLCRYQCCNNNAIIPALLNKQKMFTEVNQGYAILHFDWHRFTSWKLLVNT